MRIYESRPTQEDMILDYIEENGSINRVKAAHDLGIFELAARIAGLEKKGYIFDKTRCEGTNRYGGRFHYTEYRLVAS